MITIYVQPSCNHCEYAKQYLDSIGIPYEEKNIRADASALEFMRAEQCGSTPQLYVGKHLLVGGGNAGLRTLTKDQILERIIDLAAR